MTSSKDRIKKILTDGNPAEKRAVFEFSKEDTDEMIALKFELYGRSQYPRYFKYKSAKEHKQLILNLVACYRSTSKQGTAEIAFRGFGKTSIAKLFLAFVLQNDKDAIKKFIKVLTLDGKNSKQTVTDVYNLMVETEYIYGDLFEKEGDKKREETMSAFTMKKGVKLASGTVGQTQRGHIQDAFRPDLIWFDDVEDAESVSSIVITVGVITKLDEAIQGLAIEADWFTTANYISDTGSVQWLLDRCRVKHIVPVEDENGDPTWDAFTPEAIAHLRATAEDFYGEYMCDPTRSKDKFFDVEQVERDMKATTGPTRTSADVRYWSNYKPHHYYGQGSDHSEGIGKDANALAGFDFKTGELVYTYANNTISPDLAAHEFARVGAEFGNCMYAPEINNKCGGIVITTLKGIGYPHIYRHVRVGNRQDSTTDKLGWETNSLTKTVMFMDFRRDYRDGLIKIYDIDVLKEMKAYTNADLTRNPSGKRSQETPGLKTRHFDLLTAVVIAWQMRNHFIDNTPAEPLRIY